MKHGFERGAFNIPLQSAMCVVKPLIPCDFRVRITTTLLQKAQTNMNNDFSFLFWLQI